MQLQLFLHADALLVVIRTHQLLNVVTHKKILATIFFCMSYDHPMLTHSWCVKKFHARKIFYKNFMASKIFDRIKICRTITTTLYLKYDYFLLLVKEKEYFKVNVVVILSTNISMWTKVFHVEV